MIAVIDYGMGNIGSVCNALRYVGAAYTVTDEASVIETADGLILPGVGAFGDAIRNISDRNLELPIKEFIGSNKPFLGICLGYQLLYERSSESPDVSGLGVLKGEVIRFPDNMKLKVPHIGWNTIRTGKGMKILGKFNGAYMYFVHSYYVLPETISDCHAITEYGVKYASAVEKDNILACQFHPEKSGREGLDILRKWTVGAR